MPLRFDDASLREVFAAAAMVLVQYRSQFLHALARELEAQPVIGPGLVHRVAHAMVEQVGKQLSERQRRVGRSTKFG